MTFNIFLTTLAEDEIEFYSDVWANRADYNVATIKRYRPDLIGFQEFCHDHWQTYREQLDEYRQYGVEQDTAVIFWKPSRFEWIGGGSFWLGDDPHERIPAWGADDPLSATWVKLKDVASGFEFLFLNTHLDDVSEESRVKSTRLILEQLTLLNPSHNLPVIVTGDFNCNPWSPVYRDFLQAGFVDTFRAAGHGDSAETSTFHGFHGKDYFALEWGDQVFWRVDWILVRDGAQRLQTTSCTIVRDAAPPVYASDHYPVVSELLV
jgi:endonuclease/exonuclease/phosphatase family metal-dependent hydrolase